MLIVNKKETLMETIAEQTRLQEHIEVTINKSKLQIYGAVIGGLLSIFTVLTYKVLDGIDTLKENSQDFKTYIQTNDLRNVFTDKRLNDMEKAAADRLKRIERLEEKEAAFWKEYGYLFNQPKK